MEFLLGGLIVSTLGGLIGYVNWSGRKYRKWLQHIDTRDALFHDGGWGYFQFCLETPHDLNGKWQRGLMVISHKRIAIYQEPETRPLFTVQPHELRGFWRPSKYESGINEMWIHAQIGVSWHILKIKLFKSSMARCVRAMKQIATEEQSKAYRRRRPYIHREPSAAHPATQNLQGAWELEPPVKLYIMPLHLVLFNQQDDVINVLDLADIQNIAALKRIEGGKPDGLMRFSIADETYAFAMDDYESWAEDLAEAAKRTLEEPIMQKRKGKDDDDDNDFDE